MVNLRTVHPGHFIHAYSHDSKQGERKGRNRWSNGKSGADASKYFGSKVC